MKKRFIINFIIILVSCIMPIMIIFIIGFSQENKYQDSFYAGLKIKDERLNDNLDKKKIIFVGGSSLSFGLRSDLISDATNYEVINYGLYAPLGTKTMMELIKSRIRSDDVIIIAPELSKETYSTYMNYNMLLKCSEDTMQFINKLKLDDRMNLIFNYPNFVFERNSLDNNLVSAPYNKESFNEYGDISSDEVKRNILTEYYDSASLIEPNTSLLDKDFIKYLNSYAKYVKRKKANIYFSFSPTNVLALKEEGLEEFEEELNKALDFDILGSVKDFTYHQYYFYDTNYHLNYAGSINHSKNITSYICKALDIESNYNFNVPLLPEPKYNIEYEFEKVSDSNFTYSILSGDYYLSNVSSDIKDKQIIRVPDKINGNDIVGILSGAFKDFTNLKYVILPSKIDSLQNKIFDGCTSLERIYFTNEIAPQQVGNGLLEGCNPYVRIYILKNAAKSFNTGYTWINYKRQLETYDIEEISKYL